MLAEQSVDYPGIITGQGQNGLPVSFTFPTFLLVISPGEGGNPQTCKGYLEENASQNPVIHGSFLIPTFLSTLVDHFPQTTVSGKVAFGRETMNISYESKESGSSDNPTTGNAEKDLSFWVFLESDLDFLKNLFEVMLFLLKTSKKEANFSLQDAKVSGAVPDGTVGKDELHALLREEGNQGFLSLPG